MICSIVSQTISYKSYIYIYANEQTLLAIFSNNVFSSCKFPQFVGVYKIGIVTLILRLAEEVRV